jgi:Rrf2 family protein
MRLSTRMRYGTRVLCELAAAYPEGTLSVRELALRQDLSAKYLEQIMVLLRTAGLVRGMAGVDGGYALARAPRTIRMSDVYTALQGSFAVVQCVTSPESCPRSRNCPTRALWALLSNTIQKTLDKTTLQTLLADAHGQTGSRTKKRSRCRL